MFKNTVCPKLKRNDLWALYSWPSVYKAKRSNLFQIYLGFAQDSIVIEDKYISANCSAKVETVWLKSIQLHSRGNYKKCVQYGFNCTSDTVCLLFVFFYVLRL